MDLNQYDDEGEMVGSIMKKKEKRSYIFVLSPKSDLMRIK